MACDTQLVSIGVAEVGAVVVLMVLGPQAWCAFRSASVSQCNVIRTDYASPTSCQEGDHVPVACLRRKLIVWLRYQEQGPWPRSRLPTCPGSRSLTEAEFNA